jgi:hypothetical protein
MKSNKMELTKTAKKLNLINKALKWKEKLKLKKIRIRKENKYLTKQLPYIQSILDVITHIKNENDELEKREFIE